LELRAKDTGAAASDLLHSAVFLFRPNVARVNLAMDIPGEIFISTGQGKISREPERLGIAYRPDERWREIYDQVKLDLEKDEWKEFRRGRITT